MKSRRPYKNYKQYGGTNEDVVPNNVRREIINQIIEELRSWVTIGFADDGDRPLTEEQFEQVLRDPQIRIQLRSVLDDLEHEYIADNSLFPFYGDFYRESFSEFGVYDLLNRYRVPESDVEDIDEQDGGYY